VSSGPAPKVTNSDNCNQLKQNLPGALNNTNLQYFHSNEKKTGAEKSPSDTKAR